MFNRVKVLCLLVLTVLSVSGCSLLNTAISAAAAYGIYQVTKK
jgi:hypothetical protein